MTVDPRHDGRVADSLTPGTVFAQDPLALALVERVRDLLNDPSVDVHTTKTQVAFRRRRGFAYVWVPGHFLRNPRTPAVLSIAFHSRIDSPRFAETVHPSPTVWMHHLDVRSLTDVDDEVAQWLRDAAAHAA